jgi:hypothetical protein
VNADAAQTGQDGGSGSPYVRLEPYSPSLICVPDASSDPLLLPALRPSAKADKLLSRIRRSFFTLIVICRRHCATADVFPSKRPRSRPIRGSDRHRGDPSIKITRLSDLTSESGVPISLRRRRPVRHASHCRAVTRFAMDLSASATSAIRPSMAAYKGDGRNASQPNVTAHQEFLPEQEMRYVKAKRAFKRSRFPQPNAPNARFCPRKCPLQTKKGSCGHKWRASDKGIGRRSG